LQPESDSVLIEKMMAGDEDALSLIYDRYSAMLFGVLIRILHDSQIAEEVLQDLFLQLWRKAGQFDATRGSLPVWLLVMGRNRAISRLRRRTDRAVTEDEVEVYANTFLSSENLENEVSRRDLMEKVREAVLQLPAEQRRTVELAYFEGLTQTEIAAKTGSPLGTVKTRVRAALQTLKQILDDRKTRQPGRL
jgi:RNA polymerase sigma-70 factor (ECF subfamily)